MKPKLDWKKEIDTDPDDEQIETPQDVIDVLGFDPVEESRRTERDEKIDKMMPGFTKIEE